MKFLVDAGVGKKVEAFLKLEGYDVRSVRDINHSMNDVDILKIATDEKRIVVTMDKDFGELVYNSGIKYFGVFLLRLEDMNSEEKTMIVTSILEKYASELADNFCVFQKGKFRIRRR